MARDQRWPLGWTITLMTIHLVAAIALMGLAASDLSTIYGVIYTWSYWIVPQACVVIIATIIHIVCVCSAKLNPGWTLAFYLVMWLAWVALAAVTGITYSFWSFVSDSSDYYYNGYYYSYGYDYYNLLTIPKVVAELALISVCSATGLAIWIFCCVIVHRWRRERMALMLRGSQMPIQYVNVQYPGQFAGQPPGQYQIVPVDPNQKMPYPIHYTVPPTDPNMVQYPAPIQSPPQNFGQYPPPTQSPDQHQTGYPPPSQSPVQYPAPVQSPVPSRKPLQSVSSDEYPTYYENQRNP